MATPLDALLDGVVDEFYRVTDSMRDLLARGPLSSSATKAAAIERARVAREAAAPPTRRTHLHAMPIHLQLHRMCTAKTTPEGQGESEGEVEVEVDGKVEIDASPAIRMRLMYADGHGGGVVAHVIEIHVASSSVPTLDLIDLPGLVAGRLPGEPDDMMAQTRAHVAQYLWRPDTLVLAVVPAYERVRNSQAPQLIQQYKLTDRTIGVLTMVDRAAGAMHPAGPLADLRATLCGTARELVPLVPHGCVAFLCHDTRGRATHGRRDGRLRRGPGVGSLPHLRGETPNSPNVTGHADDGEAIGGRSDGGAARLDSNLASGGQRSLSLDNINARRDPYPEGGS